ncbi:DUF6165 family protein [Thalassoglobus sp. JC818]|uniref:DUF6165 family protein n=1 Tax=Thalassoglobus sp. JC818 TaxID=3232136 RepID=UPI00345877FC
MTRLTIEISPGELLDRISILELKHHHTCDDVARTLLSEQIEQLVKLRDSLPTSNAFAELAQKLSSVNGRLWNVEDSLRNLEQAKLFESEFIELARSVYRLNDERSQLKRDVDELLGWKRTEIKVYSKDP